MAKKEQPQTDAQSSEVDDTVLEKGLEAEVAKEEEKDGMMQIEIFVNSAYTSDLGFLNKGRILTIKEEDFSNWGNVAIEYEG